MQDQSSKKCGRCKDIKPISEFHRNKSNSTCVSEHLQKLSE